jgi:hypothetical protein
LLRRCTRGEHRRNLIRPCWHQIGDNHTLTVNNVCRAKRRLSGSELQNPTIRGWRENRIVGVTVAVSVTGVPAKPLPTGGLTVVVVGSNVTTWMAPAVQLDW